MFVEEQRWRRTMPENVRADQGSGGTFMRQTFAAIHFSWTFPAKVFFMVYRIWRRFMIVTKECFPAQHAKSRCPFVTDAAPSMPVWSGEAQTSRCTVSGPCRVAVFGNNNREGKRNKPKIEILEQTFNGTGNVNVTVGKTYRWGSTQKHFGTSGQLDSCFQA